MSDSHPVEMAWRQFAANKGRMRVFRECFRRIPATLENLRTHGGITAWPPGVVLSMAVPATLAVIAQRRLYPNEPRGPVIPLFRDYSNTMHVWAAYRESKSIYQVEPYLIECLARTPWPDSVPVEAIGLTSYCPILEFQWQGQKIYIAATYDVVPEVDGSVSINISRFIPPVPDTDPELLDGQPLWQSLSAIMLVRNTLRESIEYTVSSVNQAFPGHTSFDFLHGELAGLVINLLLYLRGEPDVVQIVHPGDRPAVRAMQKRDPERYKDLHEPAVHAVGQSFTRAIEHWEIERAKLSGDVSGQTVRPHMRRAHAHLYWTGEGHQQPRVKFLLPISVKGGKLVEEPTAPTQIKVR